MILCKWTIPIYAGKTKHILIKHRQKQCDPSGLSMKHRTTTFESYVRAINNAISNSHTDPLFKSSKMIKFNDLNEHSNPIYARLYNKLYNK
jgi:hypothetical protein